MRRRNTFKHLLMAFSITAFVASCSQNDEMPDTQESQVTVSATVANSSDPNARMATLGYGNLVISDITMSVDRVLLNLRATSDNSKKPTIVNVNSKGQKIIKLVEDGEVMVSPLGSVSAANGVYGKLDFDLVKAMNVPEDDEMYGKSVLVKGNWFDTPATMYIDLEETFKILYPQGIEVDGAQEVVFGLYLDKFFEDVDPSLISDGDGDGTIEVGPNGEDGNEETYNSFLANIESALFLKDGEFKN